jgi:hypothetical protein
MRLVEYHNACSYKGTSDERFGAHKNEQGRYSTTSEYEDSFND